MNEPKIEEANPEHPAALAGAVLGCCVCGGKMVAIRGRRPNDKPRKVCPTCLAERLDAIRELTSVYYGMAGEGQPNDQ